jgi:hypothetical protein
MFRQFLAVVCLAARLTLALTVFATLLPAIAHAIDDRENAEPTAWYVYSGQTPADIASTASSRNLRAVDIAVDTVSPAQTFTVTYVSNTGSYQKTWWFFVDIDAETLSTQMAALTARPIALKAYDNGLGQIRFAVVAIANAGDDDKAWWWWYDQTEDSLIAAYQMLDARITQITSYTANGATRYAALMLSNTGPDARYWWWYINQSGDDVAANLYNNQARLVDLDRDPATGNFNVVMTGCSTDCPLWWWWFGTNDTQMLANAAQTGARIIDATTWPGCGSLCYAYVLINNSNPITSRVGQLLRNGTDGAKGLYLKEIGGPVLANLAENWTFEPASAIKVVAHAYAMYGVQAGSAHLTDAITRYQPPGGTTCPGNTVIGNEPLGTAMAEMMRHSDNTRTREIIDHFGVANINANALLLGMTDTSINHVLGCGGPIPNQTTLQDLGLLYEKVADGTLLDTTNRATFYSLMAGKAQYQLEGSDWTGLWSTDIPALITQEAPADMPAALTSAWRDQMNLAYQAGNYKICDATCASYVDHVAIAGWARIPYCGAGGFAAREYVFGLFINNSTSDTTSGDTFNATRAELLREQIRAGLASCAANPPAPVELTVTRTGTGSGTVISQPAGIDCGGVCSAPYYAMADITLTATPAPGSMFAGWSGACSGTGPCALTMTGAQSATARFALSEDGFGTTGIPPRWIQPNGSTAPWGVVNDASYAGSSSLKAGSIGANQTSAISYTARFKAGTVSFARRVSSQPGGDVLEFLVDGVVKGSWSGSVPWSVVSYPLAAGRHTLVWRYRKNASVSTGSDTAWIDSVVLPSLTDITPILMLLQ